MTGGGSAPRIRRLALRVWLLLLVSVAAWPFASAGIGLITTLISLLPLVLPIPDLLRARRRVLQWAPLTLAPVLALTLAEILANAAARIAASVTLALILAAFAVTIAALRASPPAN